MYVGIFRCGNCESRVAAYRLLIELAKGNYAMLKDVCKQLIEMHHLPQPDCANEWEVGHFIPRHVSCMSLIIQNKRFLIEKLVQVSDEFSVPSYMHSISLYIMLDESLIQRAFL